MRQKLWPMKFPRRLMPVSALAIFCVALIAAAERDTSVTVKSVWIYPFENGTAGSFSNVTIMEKNAAGVKFKAGGRVFEHNGHYTIEN